MMAAILITLFITLFLCLLTYYFIRKKNTEQNHVIQIKNVELEKSLHELKSSTISLEEKKLIEEEKKKTEEKNKKIWQMSETVYKEKKKVDEQIELLQTEKEKLEAEKKKVDEKVKKLWSQSTAIHKEKERINELKLEIEHRHQEIIDSVNYAKRIQEAILPDRKEISAHISNSFILFKPRNIVSGDFYWFSHKEGKSIIAAVDCTGHGVPGAFMSMIGNTILNQIVNEREVTDPAQILNLLNEEINASLKQTQQDSESRDGMDIAICSFEPEQMKMQYAGANRPLYFVRDNQLTETKADKFPIGGLDYDIPKIFNTHTFLLQKDDVVYISTDGYADQFGTEDTKLMTRKFKEKLLSIHTQSMEDQRNYLDSFIENWKGNVEQTDDILVIGIKI
jgi:serine phosphatase RsbU (regulator of sigma subunit)